MCDVPTTNITIEIYDTAWKGLRGLLNAPVRERGLKYRYHNDLTIRCVSSCVCIYIYIYIYMYIRMKNIDMAFF
jgi:hypothetical protein